MRLHVETDRPLARAGASSTRHVRVSFTAPESRRQEARLPVNVSLVLDRSGSMGGGKLELARVAAEAALAQLRPDDRFSLVVYDDRVDLLVASTPATAEARARAAERLRHIEPRGSTDLCSGWLTGCEQVGAAVTDESVGRCLLLTDGLANRGTTDPHLLATHAAELRARGVATSTFGVGRDFDERLLSALADAGAGNFYYLRTAEQIPEFLAGEVGEALEVVARDVELEVHPPEGADVRPLGRQAAARQGRTVRIEVGDMVSEQEIDLVLAVRLPAGREGDRVDATFTLRDRDGTLDAVEERLGWTFASHLENDRQARNRAVDRVVARAYAARARAEAVERNRRGDLDGARQVLLRTAGKIRGYAGHDPELRALARELERDSERYAAEVLDPGQLKEAHFLSYAAARSRDPQGKARRARR